MTDRQEELLKEMAWSQHAGKFRKEAVMAALVEIDRLRAEIARIQATQAELLEVCKEAEIYVKHSDLTGKDRVYKMIRDAISRETPG